MSARADQRQREHWTIELAHARSDLEYHRKMLLYAIGIGCEADAWMHGRELWRAGRTAQRLCQLLRGETADEAGGGEK